ncbi:MAG: ABC transporter ATP-binding protein [Propionicimonas sp.]
MRLEGGIELVHDLSLTLAPGEALGIVGESGSGKSLTLRAIMDLLPRGITRTAGRIEIGGRAGMIFQDPLSSLDPMMTVGRQVAEVCWVRSGASRQASRARVRELFGSVRLPQPEVLATRYPHQLSGGQRQRVLLALALAGDPDILLCDEPTTALDVTVQREVLALLADLRTSRGMSLLFVSHDLAVVSQVCDRVVVLREGRVIEQASTRQIVTAPTEDYTRQLVEAVLPLPPLAPIAGAADV